MRIIKAEQITENIKEMCMEANIRLADDVRCRIEEGIKKEESEIGRQILGGKKT